MANQTKSRIVAELVKNVNVRAPLEKKFAISVQGKCFASSSYLLHFNAYIILCAPVTFYIQ